LKTIIEKVDFEQPIKSIEVIEKAAGILNKGGLVAFPTETVYGLGANAFDKSAVKKIYQAKGRPSDNPLIVHISNISQLKPLVKDIPLKAQKLINAFWPGPLTIIFKKSELIPYETSGGLETVAIRFPANKTAQLLIEKSKIPIAAPSANSSGKPSPTHASHVIFDLDGKIDMIINGGHCIYGLESTILDVSENTACLLRPGSITKNMIEEVIGNIEIDKVIMHKLDDKEKPKAPGMKYTHYSPNANIEIVNGEISNVVNKINELVLQKIKSNITVGVIATEQTKNLYNCDNILIIGDRNKPETIAANLFKILRKCDYLNIAQVYVEAFEDNEIGLAIMNRLKKAAGYNIINV